MVLSNLDTDLFKVVMARLDEARASILEIKVSGMLLLHSIS